MTTKKSTANQLFCWWGDTHIATLRAVKFNDIRLSYSSKAQELWPTNTPLLSYSLPVQSEEQPASAITIEDMIAEAGSWWNFIGDAEKIVRDLTTAVLEQLASSNPLANAISKRGTRLLAGRSLTEKTRSG